jgi:hypothetical protein
VKKYIKRLRKLSGIFTETFRKFSSPFIFYSVSHMHRTPMGCLGLTFCYMQCSNMLHKCEKKYRKSLRKFSSLGNTTLQLFADDAKLYSSVDLDAHSISLQQSLDNLCAWADRWQLSINISKCSVLSIASKTH